MSIRSEPWMRFFPSDWRSDPALRMCGMAARGLWIEMLGVMFEAKPRGHLLVKGAPPTAAQLAVIVGCSEAECSDLLAELERNGVFSRKRNGVIFSRRMEADEIKARKNRDNGRKGGNPKLLPSPSNPDGKPPADNRPLNREDKAQKPEARSQIREEKKDSLSQVPVPPSAECAAEPFQVEGTGPSDDRFAEFWAAYPKPEGRDPAEVEFIRACVTTPADTIIAGARVYAASRSGQEPRFTMQAARWLKERRWTDTPTPAEPPPKSAADRFRRIAASYGPTT